MIFICIYWPVCVQSTIVIDDSLFARNGIFNFNGSNRLPCWMKLSYIFTWQLKLSLIPMKIILFDCLFVDSFEVRTQNAYLDENHSKLSRWNRMREREIERKRVSALLPLLKSHFLGTLAKSLRFLWVGFDLVWFDFVFADNDSGHIQQFRLLF